MTKTRAHIAAPDEPRRRALQQYLAELPDITVVGTSQVHPDELPEAARNGPRIAIVCLTEATVPALAFVAGARAHRPRIECLTLFERPLSGPTVEALFRAGVRGILPETTEPEALARAAKTVSVGGVVLAPGITDLILDWASLAQHQSFAPGLEAIDVEVLSLLSKGNTVPEVANSLMLDEHSIRASLRLSKKTLGATSQHRAVATALRQGLI